MFHYGHLQANYLCKKYKHIPIVHNHKILIRTNFHTNGQLQDNCNIVETRYQHVLWKTNIHIKNVVLKV